MRLNRVSAKAVALPAIAAVLIGGTSLFGGVGSLSGTFIGALILTLVLDVNLLSVSANWQPLVTGVIVILSGLARHEDPPPHAIKLSQTTNNQRVG